MGHSVSMAPFIQSLGEQRACLAATQHVYVLVLGVPIYYINQWSMSTSEVDD